MKKGINRIFFRYSETNEGEIAAVVILSNHVPVAHIDYFFVNQEIRGKGVGSKFLTDILKVFQKEGVYEGITLECEPKLVDFYKKFNFQKIKTSPSQFQDYVELYDLMFNPLASSNQNEKEIKEVSLKALYKVKKIYGYVLDGSESNKRIWRKTNDVVFREVKLKESDGPKLFENAIDLLKLKHDKEDLMKELKSKEIKIFLIMRNEKIIAISLVEGNLKKDFDDDVNFYYDTNSGIDLKTVLTKLHSCLLKEYHRRR